MFKEKYYIYRRVNIIADAVITGLSFVLAMLMRVYLDTGFFVISGIYHRYFWLFYIAIVLWPVLLIVNGSYPTDRFRTIKTTTGIIAKSSIQGLLFMLALLFVFRLQIVSRLLIAGFVINVTVLLILKESIVIGILRRLRKSKLNFKNVLVIGTFKSAKDIVAKIEKSYFLGLSIKGLLVPQEELRKKMPEDIKVIGVLKDIDRILKNNPIDSVLITLDRRDWKEVDDIVFKCIEQGVEVWLVPDFLSTRTALLDTDELLGIPLVVFRMGPKFSWQLLAKIVTDIIGAFVLSILSLPIIGIAAFLIKLSSKGPVIFKQERCGLQGRKFNLYKLRTMYVGAEEMRKQLEAKNIMKGPVFKLVKDPRVTPLGYFLRKWCIDEMPQFWNVLKGDMSLVGSRPPLPEEVKQYKAWQRRRLSMKPGITGLVQVRGRCRIVDFNQLAGLDLKYIDEWNLWLDIKILFKTAYVVVGGMNM